MQYVLCIMLMIWTLAILSMVSHTLKNGINITHTSVQNNPEPQMVVIDEDTKKKLDEANAAPTMDDIIKAINEDMYGVEDEE